MEKGYTIHIVTLTDTFNRHSLSSFQVQLVEQYINFSLYIFSIFTEFSRDCLRDEW